MKAAPEPTQVPDNQVDVKGKTVGTSKKPKPMNYGQLSVQLRHKSDSLVHLSRMIEMPTTREWGFSDILDRGSNISPRVRGENFWASDMTLPDRSYAKVIGSVVLQLEKCRSELESFFLSGGKLELYLKLNGKLNVGDRLSCDLLRSIAVLNASLDVEVFPNL